MIKMKLSTYLCALFVFSTSTIHAASIPFAVSNRVDTNDAEIRKVIELYANYLNSEPEKIYDNPYWNAKEKAAYKDFDFSRSSLFQSFTAKKLQTYYPPFVLSVEREGKKYSIRVLYSSNTTDSRYIGSKVWAIHKLYALRENNRWVLENCLPNITASWEQTNSGIINYIYPSYFKFSNIQANKAEYFCKKLIERFNPSYSGKSFNFYITSTVDEMGALENFDYYFAGVTTGKSKEGMIFTAKANEFYPHEFVHQLLPNNSKRSKIIEEGLATYLGTKENQSEYVNLMNNLSSDLRTNKSINFHSIFSSQLQFNGYQIAYPAGAGICELVYSRKGDKGLIQLINGDSSDKEALLDLLTSILNLPEQEIITLWKTTILKYNTK